MKSKQNESFKNNEYVPMCIPLDSITVRVN